MCTNYMFCMTYTTSKRPKRMQSTLGNVYSLYTFTNWNNDVAGNLAFNKTASQITATSNERYAAREAVNESIDWSYAHCTFPNGMRGVDTWWMVDLGKTYKINRVIIHNSNYCE